jgi:hypothetical protein
VARAYRVNFISDAYWSSPRFFPSDMPGGKQTPLLYVLGRLAANRERWDRTGDLVRLRSRTWFFDRPREIPLRLVRGWEEAADHGGALRLEEYVEAATTLTDARIASLPYLVEEIGLPRELMEMAALRGPLRLYAALSPAQRQTLWQGEPLPVARMSPQQRQLFLAALAERSRGRSVPLDLSGWGSGSFSLTSRRLVRVAERYSEPGGPSDQTHDETAPAHGARQSGSRSAAGGSTPPDRRATLTRQPVVGLSFHFQYGPEARETVSISVAPS